MLSTNQHILALVIIGLLGSFSAFGQNTQTRDLSSFHAIKSTGSMDVVLKKGSREEVRLEVKNIEPDDILTKVENGTLVISMKKGNYWNMKAKAYVTYRELDNLSLSGSGDISCTSRVSSDKFSLYLSGSGDIEFTDLNAPSVEVALSGSGDIRLAGRADFLSLKVNGSGDIDAFDLQAREVEARVSGSGDLNVHALEALDAHISGSGDIRYKGSPNNRQVHASGSGDVQPVN